MTAKIGLKIRDIGRNSEVSREKGFQDFSAIEIISADKKFNFRKRELDKFKEELEGKELSMHSQTKRVFTEDNLLLRNLEVEVLKSEILAASYLGCQEFIVHLKNEKLTRKEAKSLSKIKKFAEQNNLEFLYEQNSRFNARNFIYNMKKINTNVVLDLCHLSMSHESGSLEMDLYKFINKIKKHVVYIHASGYGGENEKGKSREHLNLSSGKLDWKEVFKKLGLDSSDSQDRIRKIIIEIHDPEDIPETKKDLEGFLGLSSNE